MASRHLDHRGAAAFGHGKGQRVGAIRDQVDGFDRLFRADPLQRLGADATCVDAYSLQADAQKAGEGAQGVMADVFADDQIAGLGGCHDRDGHGAGAAVGGDHCHPVQIKAAKREPAPHRAAAVSGAEVLAKPAHHRAGQGAGHGAERLLHRLFMGVIQHRFQDRHVQQPPGSLAADEGHGDIIARRADESAAPYLSDDLARLDQLVIGAADGLHAKRQIERQLPLRRHPVSGFEHTVLNRRFNRLNE